MQLIGSEKTRVDYMQVDLNSQSDALIAATYIDVEASE